MRHVTKKMLLDQVHWSLGAYLSQKAIVSIILEDDNKKSIQTFCDDDYVINHWTNIVLHLLTTSLYKSKKNL